MPLTVAIVSSEKRWHGGEEQARLLASGLRRRGHRAVFLARRDGALAQRVSAEGLETFKFPGDGRSLRAVWQIRRHLKAIRPQVLHYNDSHAMTAAGLASLGLGIAMRIVARRVDFALRMAWRYRKLSDRVICVSAAVAEVCAQSGIPPAAIRVVPDGVDPARVRSGDRVRGRKSLHAGPEDRILLTVARLTDHKGHVFLLDALPAVLARHANVRLVLAGEGELADPLRARAMRLGIAGRVDFLGYRDDVPDLIQAADLFVFPSHMEGMGSTLIDAMLAGCPIVTTTAGGIRDLTGWNDGGGEPVAWSVPPRTPSALAAAINEALDQPHWATILADRARQRAERLFTADTMVEATLAVYRELLV